MIDVPTKGESDIEITEDDVSRKPQGREGKCQDNNKNEYTTYSCFPFLGEKRVNFFEHFDEFC